MATIKSIVEKAKQYELALERCRKLYNEAKANGYTSDIEDYETIFPELKESEDERIIKAIKSAVLQLTDIYLQEKYGLKQSDCIAWLEKQGEQILANSAKTCKVEPKFKAGDWVVSNRYTSKPFCITKICDTHYLVDNDSFIPFEQESDWRLWTIQDAKDGDVLASKDGDEILIFRNLDSNTSFSSYYNIKGEGEIGWSNRSFIPATKEQRDLLFQKMKEAGYEWDAENKKLKKEEEVDNLHNYLYGEQKQDVNIQINPSEYINDMGGNGCYLKNTTQNYAWSEEDEIMLKRVIDFIPQCMTAHGYNEYINWFKSIKKRVQPQPQWSKMDDVRLTSTIEVLEFAHSLDSYNQYGKENIRNNLSWLKSLKDRYAWKPSEEMLEALYRAIPENVMTISKDEMLLNKLYQGLKYGRVLSKN